MGRSQEQPSVLLADDDRTARQVYGSFFSRAGWRFEIVSDGNECVKAASQNSYDVVVTDLMMPGMDGLEVLNTLRRFKPSQAIIVVTGSGNVMNVIDAVRKGADDILLKPIDFQTLRNSVDRVLDVSRLKKGVAAELREYLKSENVNMEFSALQLVDEKVRQAVVEKLSLPFANDRGLRLRMQLAFQEAIANSIDHGSLELMSTWKDEVDAQGVDKFSTIKMLRLQDPQFAERKISIQSCFTPDRFEVTIVDEGRGFSAPTKEGEVSSNDIGIQTYGRGMAIIFGAMDEVKFNAAGTQITMVKFLK